ncbi:MAG: AAA-like domain-containing protein [Oculatellaceae cyanobacterium bins.114]|nr:AAA-like domain-containing protein [Oculatellaceae cyanobacterium bins.114]
MPEKDSDRPISFEVALKVADAAVFAKTSRHLKTIEVTVLQGVWLGYKYDQIAEENGYTPEYIKHDVGPTLWQLLSSSLGEKVSKTNLIAVLVRKATTEDDKQAEPPSSSIRLAELESPVGLVPLDSKFYIDRPPIETHCYEEITHPGALIRIKAPSQMGKTSLMVRILAHARQQPFASDPTKAVSTVVLSLQQADSAVFADIDRFLRWFCAAITRKLQISHRVDDFWSATFGSKSNCTAYFEDCVLSVINGPLIIALDQVDEMFSHPEIADDFFALLRSWYEESAYGDSGNLLWQHLRLVIVHSTEVYLPLDINKSPFNVGVAIELKEFTAEQVSDLAQRHGLTLSQPDLTALMQLISGHPFLLRRAFYHLAQQELTLSQLLETAATHAGIYRDHLHRHLRNLQEHPPLATAFEKVIQTSEPVELEQILAFKLHSMGLVSLRGNHVVPSCELYRHYFRVHLAIAP